MLKRFKVSNFKSLVNVEFNPVGLNLLVGANNAGKTNLCQALRFIGLTSRTSLYDAARACTAEPWNLLNVYTKDDVIEIETRATLCFRDDTGDATLDFTYALRLRGRRNERTSPGTRALSIDHEALTVSGGGFDGTTLLEMDDQAKVKLLHEESFLLKRTGPERIETSGRPDTTMLFRLYDLPTNRRANLFKRYLNAWSYYCFDPNQMRSNIATPMDRTLDSMGSNLNSVLFTLNSERPRDIRKLTEAVRQVEPRLDTLSFQSPDPEHVHLFLEDKDGHRFGVQNISDGTLRYLGLALLIIAHRPGPEDQEYSPLLMIEEPENGIYVGHLRSLLDKIDPSGEQGQFLFTSHSPYFIDLFDAALDGVCVVRNLGNYSMVTKPDTAKLRERLAKFSLGDIHFRGLWE